MHIDSWQGFRLWFQGLFTQQASPLPGKAGLSSAYSMTHSNWQPSLEGAGLLTPQKDPTNEGFILVGTKPPPKVISKCKHSTAHLMVTPGAGGKQIAHLTVLWTIFLFPLVKPLAHTILKLLTLSSQISRCSHLYPSCLLTYIGLHSLP